MTLHSSLALISANRRHASALRRNSAGSFMYAIELANDLLFFELPCLIQVSGRSDSEFFVTALHPAS